MREGKNVTQLAILHRKVTPKHIANTLFKQ